MGELARAITAATLLLGGCTYVHEEITKEEDARGQIVMDEELAICGTNPDPKARGACRTAAIRRCADGFTGNGWKHCFRWAHEPLPESPAESAK